jgi:phosphate transport system protein
MHLHREIENLKGKTLSLAARVEESLRLAIRSVRDRDPALAQRVIDGDQSIDLMEVMVEEECLKVLALHQPVAIDLRFIVAVIKVNNELERIGDLASDVAERAIFLSERDPIALPPELLDMSSKVQAMVRKSLDALVNMDTELARETCASDDEVDDIHRGMFQLVQRGIVEHPEQVETYLPFLSISRYLERVADHATNIAEDVIYSVEGQIVRHQPDRVTLRKPEE